MRNELMEALLRGVYWDLSDAELGICANVADLAYSRRESPDAAEAWLEQAFERLGLDKYYPVPHPDYPAHAFRQAYDRTVDMWVGEYGENRRYLLELLIRMASGGDLTSADVAWPYPSWEN